MIRGITFAIIWKFTKKFILGFIILSVVSTILLRFIPIPFTPLMISRCFEQMADGEDIKLEKDWVPLEEISPNLPVAVVCAEDQKFLDHHGFDFDAIQKAIKHNRTHDKKIGASTISQQTAKNVFLWESRTWLRKGLEVYFTILIETFWSKERIMEVYLNIVELGPGIYGAEAASQIYFNKPAIDLNKKQAATLTVMLPSPLKYSATNPGPYVRGRIDWTLKQMRFFGNTPLFDLENSDSNNEDRLEQIIKKLEKPALKEILPEEIVPIVTDSIPATEIPAVIENAVKNDTL